MKFISKIPLALPIVQLFAADLIKLDADDSEFLSQVGMNIEAHTPHVDVIEHYAVPYRSTFSGRSGPLLRDFNKFLLCFKGLIHDVTASIEGPGQGTGAVGYR